jgi:hypothetical protein
MDSIYSVLDSNEVDYNDDVMFIDNPDDYEFENEFNNWGDDVTIIGDFEEDEFNFDLGEGYIPLPKGDDYNQPVIVIDEYYNLDEYEIDILEGIVESESVEYKESTYSTEGEESLAIDVEKAESITNFGESNEPVDELTNLNMCPDDERVVKAMARDYMENLGTDTLLEGEFQDASDDTSWIDDPDLFGNDISVIIADNPEADFVEDDFVDGSFEQWLAENSDENIIW